jgi:hypothetical protein
MYTVKLSVVGGDEVSFPIAHGSKIDLDATPNAGWQIKRWTLDGVEVNGTNAVLVIDPVVRDHIVTVEFELIKHTISFGVKDGMGTVSAVMDGVNISFGTSVSLPVVHGSKIYLGATPNPGWQIKRWILDGVEVNGTDSTLTINPVDGDHTVTVEFELIVTTYQITFGVVGGTGGISAVVDGISILSGARVEEDKTVVFTLTPGTGYRVLEWRVGGTAVPGNKTNTLSLPVTDNYSVEAVLEVIMYTVTLRIVGGDEVSIPLAHGSKIDLDATPDTGWQIRRWTLDGVEVNGRNNILTIDPIIRDHLVTVEFELESASSGSDEPVVYMLTFDAPIGSGTFSASVGGTTVECGTDIQAGQSVVLTAMPEEGMQVKGWFINGELVGTSLTYIIHNISDASTVTLEFERIPYKITFLGYGGIIIDIQEGVLHGSYILLPNDVPKRAGYTFVSWDGFSSDMTATGAHVFTAIWQEDTGGVLPLEWMVAIIGILSFAGAIQLIIKLVVRRNR